MPLSQPPRPDALRPTEDEALAAWAERVRADQDQMERYREVDEPSDFYAPIAQRFSGDPRRTGDFILEALLEQTLPPDSWLDIGAGGGRFALPLALHVRSVEALDPSPAMLEVLRTGVAEHAIDNVVISEGSWPFDAPTVARADGVLMAHVGYTTEDIGAFLDAAEGAAGRVCVAVGGEAPMRTTAAAFWLPVHGERREQPPAIPELVSLLMTRGSMPSVQLAPRGGPAFDSFEGLMETARRQLWVRPGSTKDRSLEALVAAAAVHDERGWYLEAAKNRVAIVAWEPREA